MRTDFAGGRHFLRSERSDSGRHKVTLWRPEKMAVRGKDVADTDICCAREASVSGAQYKGSRSIRARTLVILSFAMRAKYNNRRETCSALAFRKI